MPVWKSKLSITPLPTERSFVISSASDDAQLASNLTLTYDRAGDILYVDTRPVYALTTLLLQNSVLVEHPHSLMIGDVVD